MKRAFIAMIVLLASLSTMAQGWPENYKGVMLQAFYWDSYSKTKWAVLEKQADELSQYFQLVWIPQSGNCGGTSMGYDDYYWFPGSNHYYSSFGSEAQLRSMINTFKDKQIKTIADVVINHRRSGSGWFGFPSETYNGVTYSMTAADVCKNDDGGKAQTEATRLGLTLGANDTGEDWDGMRDLDHTSENVQTVVKAYLHALLEDLGYAGFRYDMTKGYSGTYTGLYNSDSKPEFSVGEYWDGNVTAVKNWINKTKVDNVIQSAAFDFPFRYTVRDACNNGNWSKLANSSLITDASFRRYSVTFVENHDTEYRSSSYPQDPLKKDTLAANAYLLAMPGTPCVFFKHWIDLGGYIKPMIEARQLAGISNTSSFTRLKTSSTCYAVSTDDRLIAVLGNVAEYTPTGEGWVKILDGYHHAYYIRNTVANTAWASLASGNYLGVQQVVLAAITTQDARMVYTLDGSEPTASSPSVASGEKVTIPEGSTTLKAAMLVNGAISGDVITRNYEVEHYEPFAIPDFCIVNEGEICAFFEAPSGWGSIKCYTWTGSTPFDSSWPGKACTQVGTRAGKKVWKWSYEGTKTTLPANIIFNDGSKQTGDLTFTNGGYYDDLGVKGVVTGIQDVVKANKPAASKWYTLDGRKLQGQPTQKGLYIVNGKKVIIN